MSLRFAAVLAVACCASSALAQRVTVVEFTGPGAAATRNQLVGAVCDTADCVATGKTTTKGKPDWKKARKESVKYFVAGAIAKKGANLTLDLQVLAKAGAPKARKSFALEKGGTLAPKNLQAAMDLLTAAFGRDEAPPEPVTPPVEPVRPPPPPPKGTPGPTTTTKPPSGPANTKGVTLVDPPEGQPRPPPEPSEPPPAPAKRGSAKFLVIDVGADVLNRRLSYSQVATANLRSYDLALFAQPAVGLQFYPLALMRDDLLAGLGVELGLALAPWLQSRLASAPEAFPTSTLRFDGGLTFRIVPSQAYKLAIVPYVGVRSQSFTVGALSDGRRLDGLPNIEILGLRAGLGLEVPVVGERLVLFGRFGVIPVLGAGEILSAAFFPNGSALDLVPPGARLVRVGRLRAHLQDPGDGPVRGLRRDGSLPRRQRDAAADVLTGPGAGFSRRRGSGRSSWRGRGWRRPP
jgi:hypothetical protein